MDAELAAKAAEEWRAMDAKRIMELEEALREVVRLRHATHEGSHPIRMDRIWEVASAALRKSHPSQ